MWMILKVKAWERVRNAESQASPDLLLQKLHFAEMGVQS